MISYASFFFFNDTATTEIYTLSLHDALPISESRRQRQFRRPSARVYKKFREERKREVPLWTPRSGDRKSTRLNSSHLGISYAVFCLKKKTISFSRTHSPKASSR